MPREERFFELFARHAQVTLTGAEALRALLQGGDAVLRHCKEISARENEADEITREVLTALRRTFITPLDRGDIKDLITSMDDAIDQMNKTAGRIHCWLPIGRFFGRATRIPRTGIANAMEKAGVESPDPRRERSQCHYPSGGSAAIRRRSLVPGTQPSRYASEYA